MATVLPDKTVPNGGSFWIRVEKSAKDKQRLAPHLVIRESQDGTMARGWCFTMAD
jgi:hypothetical protein